MMATLPRDRVGVSLREQFPAARFLGATDVRCTSLATEAKNVRPGDLFVALVGAERDSHHDAALAIAHGAAGVLTERLLPVSVPQCLVEHTGVALGELCQALAGEPAKSLATIGVAGTNGKTTVALLTEAALLASGVAAGSLTDVGFSGVEHDPTLRAATATAPRWANSLAELHASGCEAAVIELHAEALAKHALAGVALDAAVLTGIRRGGLSTHNTLANYRRATEKTLDLLKPSGVAVVNADDRGCQRLLDRIDGPAITYGLRRPAEITATIVEKSIAEQIFLLHAGSETVPVRTRIIGEQHVSNCLAAAAVALVQGHDLATIAAGLEAISVLPRRLQRIERGQDYALFADVAETPDQLATALKAIRPVVGGKLICVFNAGRGDHEQRPLLGRVVEKHADHGIIASGDYSGILAPQSEVQDLLDGYQRPSRAHFVPDRERAIETAMQWAGRGDAVVIAGSSDDAVGQRDLEVIHERLDAEHEPWTARFAAAVG